ncbi:MAG: cyclic nucleotide-binding domain-containing protein [Deltaproteobacteria bacterium]|nr:cyclic nucleotide-binding domain-containing protein [Deltaproteobacteria bacterium]
MLEELIAHPDLKQYLTEVDPGHTLMIEGDDSQDLFILVSGRLDILKGAKKIYEIAEPGSVFGEMSFLLGAKRTATVKAKSAVKANRIPKEDVNAFLQKFPNVAGEIAKLLAVRLREASQVIHGLKETCDQLPDAVLLTDKHGHIISWNSAAKNLYGRDWDRSSEKTIEAIYEDPEAYRDFIAEVRKHYAVREKVLKIKHPEKGVRFVSTSTTLLYDGHHNFKGVLSLGRDVTAVHRLEKRYRTVRNWLIPAVGLFALVTVSVFFGYIPLTTGFQGMDSAKQGLRNQLAKDYVLLKSLLSSPFAAGDKAKARELMKQFFDIQDPAAVPYMGLVLLDRQKKVFSAYSRLKTDPANMLGSSYTGIAFRGPEESIHKVLSLYRPTREHPMGAKGVEVAFPLQMGPRFLGWLVFQMDMEMLEKTYRLDEHGLQRLRFKGT